MRPRRMRVHLAVAAHSDWNVLMYRPRLGLVVALLAWSSAAGIAHAQSSPSAGSPASDGSSSITLPTIDVSAPTLGLGFLPPPYDAAAHAVGQTVTTIDPALIENTPSFQIGDTLHYAPGISIK